MTGRATAGLLALGLALGLALTGIGVHPARAQTADDARARFEEGLAAADAGDDVTAERAFRASLALRWSVSAAFNLATVLARHDSFDEAIALLTRIEAEGPAELQARARDERRQLEAQRASARDEARRAREAAALERARAAEARGDLRGARAATEEAYALTGNPAHRLALARLAERLDDRAGALAHYRGYLESAPVGAGRAEAEARVAALDDAAMADGTPGPGATGVDGVAIGVTLGVGLALSAVAGIVAGVLWSDAEADYAVARRDCAPSCGDDVVGPIADRLVATNALLVTSVALGAATAAVVIGIAVSGGGSAEVAVGPGRVAVRGRF